MNIFIFDYLIYYTFKSQQIGNVRGVIFVTDEFCPPPLICKQIIVYVIIFLCWQRLPLVADLYRAINKLSKRNKKVKGTSA